MARAATYRRNEFEPLSALNITPLIDVMLVLLIMLIVTIPIASHKIPVDLPTGVSKPDDGITHRLDIAADGTLSWDGARIADAQLPALLASGVAANEPLHMKTDAAARYERFDDVLAVVKRAGVTKLGFVGHEAMTLD
ncbi:ExbD/TolR family protein [Sphingomonas suaedae]|nr:biopolymer transporter ExbD [Sphingomonas suaedae]